MSNDRRRAIVKRFGRRCFGQLGVEVAGRMIRTGVHTGDTGVKRESLGSRLEAVKGTPSATVQRAQSRKIAEWRRQSYRGAGDAASFQILRSS